ncbi:hypothetical protein JaAD80_27970 [Janthinobacterium sp. AD80]|nr:hypothetical protein JaAD80_27970 [Janthinobacterium sp. AD80]
MRRPIPFIPTVALATAWPAHEDRPAYPARLLPDRRAGRLVPAECVHGAGQAGRALDPGRYPGRYLAAAGQPGGARPARRHAGQFGGAGPHAGLRAPRRRYQYQWRAQADPRLPHLYYGPARHRAVRFQRARRGARLFALERRLPDPAGEIWRAQHAQRGGRRDVDGHARGRSHPRRRRGDRRADGGQAECQRASLRRTQPAQDPAARRRAAVAVTADRPGLCLVVAPRAGQADALYRRGGGGAQGGIAGAGQQ